MRNRVVITGLGAITPVGLSVSAFWESLIAGRSGVGRITRFDPANIEVQIGAEVKDFEPTNYIDRKEARRMDRFTQFAVAAAKEAVGDSGLKLENEDAERVGVIIGSGIGGMETFTDQFTC